MTGFWQNNKLNFTAAVRTHVGCVRSRNEDSYSTNQAANLFSVADGMGGYERGDTASKIICDALARVKPAKTFNVMIEVIEETIANAHRDILKFSNDECDGRTVGSTLVSLIVNNHSGACLWAGDSRLYRLRDQKLTQLSSDHSQVAELVRLGHISVNQARGHPNANLITRAIGTQQDANLDLILLDIKSGDQYLLCTDGLYNEVEDSELSSIMSSNDPECAADTLLGLCLERGARDNVTLMLINAQ